MAKPNYAFDKRQRDIAKKRKKEEKRQQKTEAQQQPPQEQSLPQPPVDETTVAQGGQVLQCSNMLECKT